MSRDQLQKEPPAKAFGGGLNTVSEKTLLPSGTFTTLKNLYNRYPGLEQRLGNIELCTTGDASTKHLSLYHFSKGGEIELHLLRQLADGSVQKADNNPPAVTSGEFSGGTDELTAVAGALPASWGNINDKLIFSDGVRQHQIWAGDDTPVDAFISYKDTGTVPNVPEIGEDHSLNVADGLSTTVGTLTTLQVGQKFFIGTQIPANSFDFTLVSLNDNVATITAKYDNGSFTAVSGFSDGTLESGTKTLGQNGTVSFTRPSDQIESFMFGRNMFWIEFTVVGANLDTVTISSLVYDTDWQALRNVWDGVLAELIHGKKYKNDKDIYFDQPPSAFDMGYFGASDKAYLLSLDPLRGIYAGVGATPHIYKASVTGSTNISFLDGGTGQDYIRGSDCNFQEEGFEEGQKVAISGTTNNNSATGPISAFADGGGGFVQVTDTAHGLSNGDEVVITGTTNYNGGFPVSSVAANTYEIPATWVSNDATGTWVQMDQQIQRVTSSHLYFETGKLTAEANQSATITYELPKPVVTVKEWHGTSFDDVSATDGGNGLTKPGFITWDHTSLSPQPRHIEDSPLYGYCYEITYDRSISNTVSVSFQGIPYFDIDEFGNGVSNMIWKERAFIASSVYGQYLVGSARNAPMTYNGADYGLLEAGDGRANRVLAGIAYFGEALAFQEERGKEGGTTTLFEGDTPSTFGKLLLSSRIGAMNAKSVAVIEGIKTATQTEERIETLAFWLSRYGVIATNGRTMWIISGEIQNYFDPTKSVCFRLGYEKENFLRYDSQNNHLVIGLVSGGSATVPNKFFNFSLTGYNFEEVERAQAISDMVEVEAASGDVTILQVGGGASDGKVHLLNNSAKDVDSTINGELVMELNGKGRQITLHSLVLRWKSQTVSTGSISAFADGGGGEVTVTDVAHGLAAGDAIIIAGTTSYNGGFIVQSITDSDNFKITATWVSDDATGTWEAGAVILDFSRDGGSNYIEPQYLSQQNASGNFVRHQRGGAGLQGDHISLRLRNVTQGQALYLYDFSALITEVENAA